jgi:uncharacterized phiE125 gp8 family phage protein
VSVDLALAKAQLRVTGTSEDTLIGQYLAAAKAWVEKYTSVKLESGEVEERFTAFSDYLSLGWGPEPAEASIAYLDTAGEEQTLADGSIVGGRLYPPAGTEWPVILDPSEIVVTYTAGYTVAPPELDQAVLLLVTEYYENRSAGDASPSLAAAVMALCSPYRLPTIR